MIPPERRWFDGARRLLDLVLRRSMPIRATGANGVLKHPPCCWVGARRNPRLGRGLELALFRDVYIGHGLDGVQSALDGLKADGGRRSGA
jgi:hypothetical protein